jgi:S-DNA-T family DNA segregation ATPase FtsK/SpoIIIE
MSTYRQIRRQTRRARRAGLQPIVVIDSGLPVPAAMLLARLAWRYRSEIAPVTTAGAVLVAGWWLHHGHAAQWPWLLAVSDLAAAVLAVLGARLGLERLAERVYAAVVVLVAGGWLAAAASLGPLAALMPQVLGAGTVLLAVPWWAHRRRRARARVQRALAAWPDISKAVALPGSKIQSATVDLWGWRARLRLARGQTIADVTARIPALESALGTYRGAVRVYPTRDAKANRCELRVLDTDPHADAISWPGPSARSITEPVDLGPFEDAEPCRVSFLRRHALFAGTTGSGKSGGLNVLIATLAACDDVVIWAIDLKKGMELGPWAPCIDRLATTPGEAAALLADAVAILQARAAYLASVGLRVWEPSPQLPALVILVDEYAELAEEAPGAMSDTDSIARLGRAVAVTLVAATQRPTQEAMGRGAVRSQMDTRICFRVRERKDVDLVLGQGMLGAGWHAHTLNAPGKFLVSAPEHTTPKRARAYLVTDDDVARVTAYYGPRCPRLDDVSHAALNSGPASVEPVPWYLVSAPRVPDEPKDAPGGNDGSSLADVLWDALRSAPEDGADVAELMRLTGLGRTAVYKYLALLAEQERAVRVGWGRWRAVDLEEGDDE